MSRTLVFVWLGTAATQAERATDLAAWQHTHAVTFKPPTAAPERLTRHDDDLAERIEILLAEAQTAVAARDPAYSGAELAQAEELLLTSPTLPESAWLMAELLRIRARWRRLDINASAEVARLLEQATALEGQRAATYADEPEISVGLPDSEPQPTIVVDVAPNNTVFVNGRLRLPPTIGTGLQHVLVTRGTRTVWARWVTIVPGQQSFRPSVPPWPACSVEDVTPVTATRAGTVRAPAHSSCPEWAVARAAPGGGIEITLCNESRCGELSAWSRAAMAIQKPRVDERAGFPGWLSWTLAGVAAAAAGGIVAWQLGAFDRSGPPGSQIEFIPPARPMTNAFSPLGSP